MLQTIFLQDHPPHTIHGFLRSKLAFYLNLKSMSGWSHASSGREVKLHLVR